MRKVRIDLGDRSYDVVVGPDLLSSDAKAQGEDADSLAASLAGLDLGQVAVFADGEALGHHQPRLDSLLHKLGFDDAPTMEIEPGEQSKSWEWARKCCDFLAASNLGRQDTVVSFGGGVVCDLAGFAASIYMRGVRFLSVPTTLLAQIDASVGGKTGINIEAGKNLVGAFHQPSLVLADIALLRTLPEREFRAGMAEVVKHGLIDTKVHSMVKENLPELAKGPGADKDLLAGLVAANVQVKANVVIADEKEAGIRAHLNLGHTFAHALEAGLGYGKLLHGEAVAIGLVAACNLSARLGDAEGSLQQEVEKVLKALGLPCRIPRCDVEVLLRPMSLDKKAVHGKMRFVLLKSPGDVFIGKDVPKEAVVATLKELKDDSDS